jgi:hypothetical protein
MTAAPNVVELRQYTLLPGTRDGLIDLFDQYFVDGQENVGIHVIGQFRDLDDPDRFVWLRGFDTKTARRTALTYFYESPVWLAHRQTATATMSDTDNALLLQPTYLGPRYPRPGESHPSRSTRSLITITIASLASPLTVADHNLGAAIRSELIATGADIIATFASHTEENSFPALPVRQEHVMGWMTGFDSAESGNQHQEHLRRTPGWAGVLDRLAARSNGLPPQHLRLRPTNRSQLR